MGSLDGKVTLVTGGSGGIGSATLRRFVREGAAVVCADINEEGGQKIVEELKSAGGRATFSRCDVTKLAEVTASVDTPSKNSAGSTFSSTTPPPAQAATSPISTPTAGTTAYASC